MVLLLTPDDLHPIGIVGHDHADFLHQPAAGRRPALFGTGPAVDAVAVIAHRQLPVSPLAGQAPRASWWTSARRASCRLKPAAHSASVSPAASSPTSTASRRRSSHADWYSQNARWT